MDGTPYGIWYYTSFFTSFWVWAYVGAGFGIRLLQRTKWIWALVVPYLNLEKEPMRAIGRVAGVLASAVYLLVVIALSLFHK